MSKRRPDWLAQGIHRYVDLAERRAGRLCAGFLLLMTLSLGPIAQLELRTDLAALLPDDHPAVVALQRVVGRQKSALHLVMLVYSPDAASNRRFAEALRPQLAKLCPQVFAAIEWQPRTELADFARRWRWLYAEPAQLERIAALLDRAIARRLSPLVVDLEDDDPEAALRALQTELSARIPSRSGPGAAPYFEAAQGGRHYLGVLLWRPLAGLGTGADREALATLQATVAALGPTRFHPQLQVDYTGQIATAVQEQDGFRADLTLATLLCTALVLLVIYLYFRRVLLIGVVGAPAVVGVLLALLLARLAIHYLNINSAFLIAIILGNGINAPIIVLARYGQERQRGAHVAAALKAALQATRRPTATAMAAAGISYGCLLLTSFRGFSQFGLIGGAGMLLGWIATFALVPPLLFLGERRWPGRFTPRRNGLQTPFSWLGKVSARWPRTLLLVSLALTGVAALALPRYLRDPFEWNFDRLRSDATPAEQLGSYQAAVGLGDIGVGHLGSYGVLRVDRPEQAEPVAAALRRKDQTLGTAHLLSTVRTLESLLPTQQVQKLELLGRLRATVDRHLGRLNQEEQRLVLEVRPPDYLRPLHSEDLPPLLLEAFTEADGQRGRLIGIDAVPEFTNWDGHQMLRMAHHLQFTALGQSWVVVSAATIFGGMLEAIVHDGPRVTGLAFLLVTLLLLLACGRRGGLVLLALLIGMVWMGGLLALFGLKLNYLNFVTLPITLGIGTDYAVNIFWHLRQDPPPPLPTVLAETGSAVTLCSLTTMIGYSSLLLTSNRALRSFGLLADLGELCCLLAALLVLPALWQVLLIRQKAKAAQK